MVARDAGRTRCEEIEMSVAKRIGRSRRRPAVVVIVAACALAACSEILDVQNPNALTQADIERAAAQTALVNGTLSSVARGIAGGGDSGVLLVAHSTVSDELKWVGSRDAWRELNHGRVRNPANEFTNFAWTLVNEGRWMSDETIRLLEGHKADGLLSSPVLLARAYLYGGIIYTFIADLYEDFVLSDRKQAGPPLGEGNMAQLYDQAAEYLGRGLAEARAGNDRALETALLAQRARTRHAKAVWEITRPRGATPGNPLVSVPAAVADAEAALALADADWKYRFAYSAATVLNGIGHWVNERLEHRFSDVYVFATADDKRVDTARDDGGIRLRDPVDDVPDPALRAIVHEFVPLRNFAPFTVVSARELHLIVAEAALRDGNSAKFATHVNAVRALDGLTPYAGQIPELEMLKHARKANLFMTGRRMADMYRFGIESPRWDAGAEAGTPGTFFPIALIERESNCHILGSC
jgi:starch-binding outer membrane protein, SusD/RagB family